MSQDRKKQEFDRARSIAIVDLGALRHNFSTLQDFAGVPVICVVKADAYGHGAIAVARSLKGAGARMLAVVCMEEAAELRSGGIGGRLLLLSEPTSEEIVEGIELDVEFSAYTPEFLRDLASKARHSGRRVSVHIKVDTGMHRLGANPDQALELVKYALDEPGLDIGGLWTHMAVADDPSDEYTRVQIARFQEFLLRVRSTMGNRFDSDGLVVHAANSAAAIAFPEARFDAVRAGIWLYGVKPSPDFPVAKALNPRPALTWKSRVSLVREIAPGARPSYGRTRAVRGTKLAVVPVGYADGYLRTLSNKADVLIRGRRHRIAGTVTMDHIVVECSTDDVLPGDEVVLIGSQGTSEISAEELALKADTIAYEVLCRIGRRVKRVYVGETE
jgi:alanine racemase